jgi:hypothetical protein
VAINRFLAKHAERSLPFIATLKSCTNKGSFAWTLEAEKSLSERNIFLAKLPTLTAPIPKERLKMYLSASNRAISAVLVVERNEKQTPIYYISRVLTPPGVNYSMLEKLVLALVHASKRQKRYFQAHIVEVLTNFPLQHVLHRPELSGRLAKWSLN